MVKGCGKEKSEEKRRQFFFFLPRLYLGGLRTFIFHSFFSLLKCDGHGFDSFSFSLFIPQVFLFAGPLLPFG